MNGFRVQQIDDVVDHSKVFSTCFNDPDGNRYKITTYDYNDVTQQFPT